MAKAKYTNDIPDRAKQINKLGRFYQGVDWSLKIHGLSLQSSCVKVDKILNEIDLSNRSL